MTTNHPSVGKATNDYSGERLMTYDGEGRELGSYTRAQAIARWGAAAVTVETNDIGITTITIRT